MWSPPTSGLHILNAYCQVQRSFLSGCHGHLYLRQKVSDNFEWKRHVLQAVMSELCILLKYENLIITRITSQIEIQFLIKVIVVINIKPTIS